jgi:alpha-glucosidase
MWAGDQNVDWSEDDGLPSVITAALSLGLSGHGLHHSDLGGYTTLYDMARSKELFMRWAELSTFTVLMRNHEGNRPSKNWQFDSDQETLDHLASMSRMHVALKPYLNALVEENASLGLPAMRPLFLHYGRDRYAWTCKDEYLLGRDLLVAPVIEEGKNERHVHLPADRWLHLWSGREFEVSDEFQGMNIDIAAPIGEPPVFARLSSPWMPLFGTLCDAW